MKIYLVSAPGHENTGYGDGLIEGQHPQLLVSFLEYAGKPDRMVRGFEFSNKRPDLTQPRRPRGLTVSTPTTLTAKE